MPSPIAVVPSFSRSMSVSISWFVSSSGTTATTASASSRSASCLVRARMSSTLACGTMTSTSFMGVSHAGRARLASPPPYRPGPPDERPILAESLARCRRQDPHGFPVLRDRAPRDLDAAGLELLGDALIGERPPRVLGRDDLADLLLHALGGDRVAVHGLDARVEEEFELEDTVGSLHVLVGGDAAHSRLVHADVLGHVAQVERPQRVRAAVEELALE